MHEGNPNFEMEFKFSLFTMAFIVVVLELLLLDSDKNILVIYFYS